MWPGEKSQWIRGCRVTHGSRHELHARQAQAHVPLEHHGRGSLRQKPGELWGL